LYVTFHDSALRKKKVFGLVWVGKKRKSYQNESVEHQLISMTLPAPILQFDALLHSAICLSFPSLNLLWCYQKAGILHVDLC
jgi:hypothetical protein